MTTCLGCSSSVTIEDTGATGCEDGVLVLPYKDTKRCSSRATTEDTEAMTEDTGATACLGCSSCAMTEDMGAAGCEDGVLALPCKDKKRCSSCATTEDT